MPALARDFTVIAVDQRGIGLSDKPRDGYDTATLANDLVGLMDALGHDRFAIVGHDTGFAIAYAVAADHPDRVDRVALAEIPGPPGSTPSPPLFVPAPLNDRLWHIPFSRVETVPEQLVQGREDVFFGYEFAIQGGALPADVIAYYVALLSQPDVLTGSFGFYRAFDATVAQNQQRKETPLDDARARHRRRGQLRRPRRRSDADSSPTTSTASRSPAPATGSPRKHPTRSSPPCRASWPRTPRDHTPTPDAPETWRIRPRAAVQRRDRVAQHRATRSRRPRRPRRARELLDADLHQLAAPRTARACLGAAPTAATDSSSSVSTHPSSRSSTSSRTSARRSRPVRSTIPSSSTTTTRSGARSPTTTGRRSTSSTVAASSKTSTSARAATNAPKRSSNSSSASTVHPPTLRPTTSKPHADWANLRSPETYLGYRRSERFGDPTAIAFDASRTYRAPDQLTLNQWTLNGDWTIGSESAVLERAGGAIRYRFHARDAHLVLAPGARPPIPFRVTLDGIAPGPAHGIDTDSAGDGTLNEGRLYQLIRQPDPIREHTLEIDFAKPGAEAYVFTFG